MADYDLKHKMKVVNCITPDIYAVDTVGTVIDMNGYKSLTIASNVGIGGITFSGTNKIELKLEHSDDNSTFVAVTDDDVLMPYGETVLANGGLGIIRSLIAAHAAADTTVHTVGYRGKKRYVRPTADYSGTHGTGTKMSVFAIVGNPMSSPAVDQVSYETQAAWPVN